MSLALAVGLGLAGCNDLEVDVDVPKLSAGAAVERLSAEGDLPRRYRVTWAGDPAAATKDVLVALHARASELCRDKDTVWLKDSQSDPDTPHAADLALVFHCVPEALPNHVELGLGEPLPDQPALAPGQQRKHGWSWGTPPHTHQDLVQEQFGDMVGDIVEDCGARATTLHRVATYSEREGAPAAVKTYVFIDYSCAAPTTPDA